MGKIADLIAQAKGLLTTTPPAEATDAVAQSRFDKRLFDEVRAEAPTLDRAVTNLSRNIDYAEDLMRDTLTQFWQGDPQLRSEAQMAESHLANLGVARDVSRADEFQSIRRHTRHDRYGAAMATIGASEKIAEWATEHGQELQAAREDAEQARKDADEARNTLDQAQQACEGAGGFGDGDGEFVGPLSDEQQAAQDALMQAYADALAADQAQQEASGQLQQQAATAQAQLRTPLSEAVGDANEQLKHEEQLFTGWGITDGEVKAMGFEERATLAAALDRSRIGPYMDLVGRFRLMEAAQQVRKIEYGREEVVGVELTDDLSTILASEFTTLALTDDAEVGELLELEFLNRWTEKQLLGRRFEGSEKVGKGAIIAVVDTSHSMTQEDDQGIPREAWAKAFSFALLDQARRQNRDFVGINFSSASQCSVYEFPSGRTNTAKALQFVQEFYGGGTNFEVPMTAAIDLLEKEYNGSGKKKADIVFITDDDCRVSTEWMMGYQARKQKLAFRTFGIAVGMSHAGGTLQALSDNVRAVSDFYDPSTVRDIFQVL